jgi:hypothetical protein
MTLPATIKNSDENDQKRGWMVCCYFFLAGCYLTRRLHQGSGYRRAAYFLEEKLMIVPSIEPLAEYMACAQEDPAISRGSFQDIAVGFASTRSTSSIQ